MSEGTEDQRDKIILNLEVLNKKVATQMSVLHIFRNSIIYGFGFVIGSTILTALIVSLVLQFLSDTIFAQVIAWIVRTLR